MGEEDLARLETEGADLCLEELGFFGCFVGQFVYDLVDIDLVAFVHFSIFNLFKLILRPQAFYPIHIDLYLFLANQYY